MSDNAPDNGNMLSFIAATVKKMRDDMETMLGQMATKSDMARLEARLEVESAAIRGDVEQVQLRLDSIERALRASRPDRSGSQPFAQRDLSARQGSAGHVAALRTAAGSERRESPVKGSPVLVPFASSFNPGFRLEA
jgi:hypothetical protein